MILRPDQVIVGRPAKDIRKFLREILHLQVSCGYAQHILGCPKEEAKQVMSALEKEGYLSRAGRHEGHDVSTGIKGAHFHRFEGSQEAPELVPAHTTA